MARSETTEAQAVPIRVQTFFYEFADHTDIGWMGTNCSGPDHIHTCFLSNFPCLYIEIEHDFHVIADETDWDDDNIFYTIFPEL